MEAKFRATDHDRSGFLAAAGGPETSHQVSDTDRPTIFGLLLKFGDSVTRVKATETGRTTRDFNPALSDDFMAILNRKTST